MGWRSGWLGECVDAAGVDTQIPIVLASLHDESVTIRKCDARHRYLEDANQLNSGRS